MKNLSKPFISSRFTDPYGSFISICLGPAKKYKLLSTPVIGGIPLNVTVGLLIVACEIRP